MEHNERKMVQGCSTSMPLKFAEAIDPEFICPLCKGPLISPVRGPCHHEFCRHCIEGRIQYLRGGSGGSDLQSASSIPCPDVGGRGVSQSEEEELLNCSGSLSLDTLVEAPKTVRLMQKMRVHCPHLSRGCTWVGQWGTMLDHVQQHCDYEYIRCAYPQCGTAVERADMTEHRKICKYRSEQCKFCLRTLKHCDLALHEHQGCDMAPMLCPQHCGLTLQKQQMGDHIEHDCPNSIVSCPFEDVGCHLSRGSGDGDGETHHENATNTATVGRNGKEEFRGATSSAAAPSKQLERKLRRSETDAHLEAHVHQHLDLLIGALRSERIAHRKEVGELTKELQQHKDTVLRELTVDNAPLSHKLASLGEKVAEQQQIIDRFTSGSTLTVDPSGCGVYRTITEALHHCHEGDMVLVRAGTYKESFNMAKQGVWIHGAGVGKTIIEINESAIHLCAEDVHLTALTVNSTSRVAPAVRINANGAKLTDIHATAKTLSCVVVSTGSGVTIKRCHMYGSHQHGLQWKTPSSSMANNRVKAAGAAGVVEECTIFGNKQSNVAVESGEVNLTSVISYDSGANGVWVRKGASVGMTQCEVYGNEFSNVDVVEGGALMMIKCISRHSKKCGLCVAPEGKLVAKDCTFEHNMLPNVVLLGKSVSQLEGCHIVSGQQHGLVVKDGARVTVKKCTIQRNALDNTLIGEGADVIIVPLEE